MPAHLEELYGVEVAPDHISRVTSRVTDAGLEEVTQWQQRPLRPLYPVVFFAALRVQIRDEGTGRTKIDLVLRNITRRWRNAPREWKEAMNQVAILYPDRFTVGV
jgi:transposase-like protein